MNISANFWVYITIVYINWSFKNIYIGGGSKGFNRPLSAKKKSTWTADSPMTLEALKSQRDAFWDTQPLYSVYNCYYN